MWQISFCLIINYCFILFYFIYLFVYLFIYVLRVRGSGKFHRLISPVATYVIYQFRLIFQKKKQKCCWRCTLFNNFMEFIGLYFWNSAKNEAPTTSDNGLTSYNQQVIPWKLQKAQIEDNFLKSIWHFVGYPDILNMLHDCITFIPLSSCPRKLLSTCFILAFLDWNSLS